MSEGRWRQIEAGYQTVRAGERSPVMAPAPTLARMAYVLEMTDSELVRADRRDAVPELKIIRDAAGGDTQQASRFQHPSRQGAVESNDVPGLIGRVVRELTDDGQLRVFEFSASVLREERSTSAVDTAAPAGASSSPAQNEKMTSDESQVRSGSELSDIADVDDPDARDDGVQEGRQ